MSRTCKEGKINNICTSDPVGSGASASVNGLSRVEIPTNRISSFLKVGEMGPEEASKLLVQTEMYVSKYTCKGRAPEFHY